MSVKTYNPADCKIVVGDFPLSGFADGSFIKIERNTDNFDHISGADGEDVSRVYLNDKTGTATITLAQTSLANAFLSGLAALDERTKAGIVPFMFKDLSGTDNHFSAQAWIKKHASVTRSKGIENSEWVITLAKYVPFSGGNPDS